MFYLPIGEAPFPVGARVRSRSRPWWGVGVVIPSDALHGWRFRVRWADGASTTAQVVELELEPAWPPSSPHPPRTSPEDGASGVSRPINRRPGRLRGRSRP